MQSGSEKELLENPQEQSQEVNTTAMETRGEGSISEESVNARQILSASYVPKGLEAKLDDHTEYYGVGKLSSRFALIMIPDMLGWKSGRIRNIADYFGSNGLYVVIPKLSGSIIEGEGDKGKQSLFYYFNLNYAPFHSPKFIGIL